MPIVVRFEDGPAEGETRSYSYPGASLPRLAWTGDAGEVQAVYDRAGDDPDPRGRLALPTGREHLTTGVLADARAMAAQVATPHTARARVLLARQREGVPGFLSLVQDQSKRSSRSG